MACTESISYTNNNTLMIKLIRKIDKWRSPTPYEKDKNQIKDNHQNESRGRKKRPEKSSSTGFGLKSL